MKGWFGIRTGGAERRPRASGEEEEVRSADSCLTPHASRLDARTSPTDPPIRITVDPGFLRNARRMFWIGLAAAVVGWLAYLVREIWLPLGIALLIAMVLDPVVDRMERRGWQRGWAAAVIFASFFLTLGVVLYFAVPPLIEQAQAISQQVGQYIPEPGQEKQAHQSLKRMLTRAHAPAYVQEAVTRGTISLSLALRRTTAWMSEHAMDVLSNLVWLVIIPIVTFYALKDFHLIFAKALLLVSRERRDVVQTMVAEVTTIFAKFLRGLALVSILNGLATWILLMILRMPNAFTLGAIAGLLYSIPYLGALTTIVLVAGVAFLHGGLHYLLLVVCMNVLLHQIAFDQFITPRILGGHVGLHPILSIIALLVGNVLLGIVGMILAVPVAACIQMVILTMVPKLRQEIALPANIHAPPDTVDSLAEETTSEQAARDATEELHRSVSEAVEHIEAAVEEAKQKDAGVNG